MAPRPFRGQARQVAEVRTDILDGVEVARFQGFGRSGRSRTGLVCVNAGTSSDSQVTTGLGDNLQGIAHRVGDAKLERVLRPVSAARPDAGNGIGCPIRGLSGPQLPEVDPRQGDQRG